MASFVPVIIISTGWPGWSLPWQSDHGQTLIALALSLFPEGQMSNQRALSMMGGPRGIQ